MSSIIVARNFYTTPPDGRAMPLAKLQSWLLDPSLERLTEVSQSGALGELIPEWTRLTGERNTQHKTHHHPLDVHTLAVIRGTRQAPGFSELTPYEQFVTLVSALLHDIDKKTGPERLREVLSVDKLHPIRSAEMSKAILTRLDCTLPTMQRVYTLIHHHQVFGRLFIFFPDGAPMEATDKIALKTRSFSLLKSLVAINEGDIRGVKCEDALFTPDVAEQLPLYYQRVEERIARYAEKTPLLPQQLGYRVFGDQNHLEHFAGFVLSAASAQELSEKLARWPWGGAQMLPYTSSFETQEHGEYAALIHVLPENIGYWGPRLPHCDSDTQIPMPVFWGLRQEGLFPETDLSIEMRHMLHAGQAAQVELRVHLQQLAHYLEVPDWVTLYRQLEYQTFGGKMAPHPWEVHCLQYLSQIYFEQSLWGLVTRPILVGVIAPEQLPDLSPEVPHFIPG